MCFINQITPILKTQTSKLYRLQPQLLRFVSGRALRRAVKRHIFRGVFRRVLWTSNLFTFDKAWRASELAAAPCVRKRKDRFKQFIHHSVIFTSLDHQAIGKGKAPRNTAGACRIRCGVRMAAARASIKLNSK
jgi:hypothetical protein